MKYNVMSSLCWLYHTVLVFAECHSLAHLLSLYCYRPPTKLRESNIFTSVSQSFCPWVGGRFSVWCHFLSDCLFPCSFWGFSVPGPMFLWGWGSLSGVERTSLWRGALCQMEQRPPWSCGHQQRTVCIPLECIVVLTYLLPNEYFHAIRLLWDPM